MAVQAWGDRAVLVCAACTKPGQPDTALLIAEGVGGLALRDVVLASFVHTDTVRAEARQ
jgi:hypothetical protein